MRTTTTLALLLSALALASCKGESVEGPLPGCLTASSTSFCSADANCCSYGCVFGVCSPNPLEGGVCRTSADCAAPRFCVAGHCSATACIGGGGSCATGPCCSGICSAGLCAGDTAPVARPGPVDLAGATVPYRIAIQLTNASSDPDNVPSNSGLTYTWSLVSGPPGAAAAFDPSASAVAPRFTPTVASATPYVIKLTVASGVLSSEATLTFTAINTPPEATMPPDVLGTAYQSRNVPLAFAAAVRDRDGGPISCTWAKKGPTAPGFTHVSGPAVCAGASGAAATGQSLYTLAEDEAGTWELQLGVDDGVNPVVSVSRFVSVQNDPPVANAGPKRWGNYGLGAIPLAGTATDVNLDVVNLTSGDATFTWEWRVTAAPTGSTQLNTLVGATPSVAFTPDHEGLYTLTLTVDDHEPGSPKGTTGTAAVDVQVEPYILPLGDVVDAAYVNGSNKVVLVETGAGNAYQLKIVDPAALDVDFVVTLAARATSIGLDPSEAEALVGEAGGRWQRVTGIQATPSIANTVPAGQGSAADLVSIAHGGTCVYGVTASGTLYLLHPTATGAPYSDAASCPTCSAANGPATTTSPGLAFNRAATATATISSSTSPWLWLRDVGSGRLGRYEIHTNCNLQTPYVTTDTAMAGKAGLWLSADIQDLFVAWTTVYDARSLSLATRFYGLPSVYPDHLETTIVGADLVGAVAQKATSALETFTRSIVDGQYVAGASHPYPSLGWNGSRVLNYGQFAFVRSGGGAYYAIVRANVGTDAAPTYRWGLVNLGP